MENTEVSPDSFATTFRDSIRVGFNWDRFFKEGWPIESVVMTSRADLARCFMPWYFGKLGNEVGYDHAEAVPMSLIDVPHAMRFFNAERQDDIRHYISVFEKEAGIVKFSVPTFSLPGDKYFVLDRNHRLAAIALSSVPFVVTLWNVCGPLETDCLLDLLHWTLKP